jgi:UDP-N-acetylmuramoyl-L-alanyl-D-glutamate--2,6-diaminopimelate ligase
VLIEGANLAEHQAELHEVSPPERAIDVAVGLVQEGDSISGPGPGHQRDYRDIRG